MSNLGEQAMEILDELHRERLDYNSEYVPLANAANLLTSYEETGFAPEDLKKPFDEEALLTMTARMMGITPDRLRELVEADRDGRCVVLPKDGMVYYIEEAGGEKWIANKPIQNITVKCGWGIASIEFSLLDAGKYFTREAAEAALKGEQA